MRLLSMDEICLFADLLIHGLKCHLWMSSMDGWTSSLDEIVICRFYLWIDKPHLWMTSTDEDDRRQTWKESMSSEDHSTIKNLKVLLLDLIKGVKSSFIEIANIVVPLSYLWTGSFLSSPVYSSSGLFSPTQYFYLRKKHFVIIISVSMNNKKKNI